MATAYIPLNDIGAAGQFGGGLANYRRLPNLVRQALMITLFPHLLETINAGLPNERLGSLTVEEAETLYKQLQPLHGHLQKCLEARQPFLVRILLSGWLRRMRSQVEHLGDTVEALAWGFDPDLQKFLHTTASEVEAKLVAPLPH